MKNLDAKSLLKKYQSGTCTPEEELIVENYLINHVKRSEPLSEPELLASSNRVMSRVTQSTSSERASIIVWKKFSVAAAVMIVALGIWYFTGPSRLDNSGDVVMTGNHIVPGSEKAILTLGNGKLISLSDAKTGVLIGESQIVYNDGKEVTSGSIHPGEESTLAVGTPRGGTYQVVLPDGTRVWLNADSKISFPSQFERLRRKILLVGEAYFEVAKDKRRPFIVTTGSQDVVVLGTRFNINAYKPGSIRTTLIEGSVQVKTTAPNTKPIILVPGEQSVNKHGSIDVAQVDTAIEMAWKMGKIRFVRAELREVMEMVSRWYDVDIVYDYYPKDGKFTGSISRSKNISEVLELLETTGEVHFKIQERKVLVIK